MTANNKDQLTEMLESGWAVVGYSSCIMAAGALVHNVLLQREFSLTQISIVTNGDKELGRNQNVLAPMPPKEKGFFERIEEDKQKRLQDKLDKKLAKQAKRSK